VALLRTPKKPSAKPMPLPPTKTPAKPIASTSKPPLKAVQFKSDDALKQPIRQRVVNTGSVPSAFSENLRQQHARGQAMWYDPVTLQPYIPIVPHIPGDMSPTSTTGSVAFSALSESDFDRYFSTPKDKELLNSVRTMKLSVEKSNTDLEELRLRMEERYKAEEVMEQKLERVTEETETFIRRHIVPEQEVQQAPTMTGDKFSPHAMTDYLTRQLSYWSRKAAGDRPMHVVTMEEEDDNPFLEPLESGLSTPRPVSRAPPPSNQVEYWWRRLVDEWERGHWGHASWVFMVGCVLVFEVLLLWCLRPVNERHIYPLWEDSLPVPT
jgi:hypothetical protein